MVMSPQLMAAVRQRGQLKKEEQQPWELVMIVFMGLVISAREVPTDENLIFARCE